MYDNPIQQRELLICYQVCSPKYTEKNYCVIYYENPIHQDEKQQEHSLTVSKEYTTPPKRVRLVYNTLTGIYNTITRQDVFCDHNKTSQYCQRDSKYVPSKAIPRVSYCVKCAGTVPPPVQPPPRSPVSYGEAGEGKRRFVKLNGMCIVFFLAAGIQSKGSFL